MSWEASRGVNVCNLTSLIPAFIALEAGGTAERPGGGGRGMFEKLNGSLRADQGCYAPSGYLRM